MNILIRLLFILIMHLREPGAGSTTLSASNRVIELNMSLTLNCSSVDIVPEGVHFIFANPSTVNRLPTINLYRKNGCNSFNLPDYISFFCPNNTLFSIKIARVAIGFHNSSVYCQMYIGEKTFDSAVIDFQVAVPVQGAAIVASGESSALLTTIENNVTRIKCDISPSYPAPNVTWYRSRHSNTEEIITENFVNSERNGTYHLIVLQSILDLNVSRNLNGTSVYCMASNGFGNKPTNSSKLQLLVHYPPSTPEFLIGANLIESHLKVIKNNRLSVSCRSDGYPTPSYFWIYNDEVISTKKILKISSTNESHKGTYECKVNNTMKWNHVGVSQKDISVIVLIPPSRPILHFNGSSVINRTVCVVKNDSFTVICESFGVPNPVCSWKQSGDTNDTLTEVHVREDFTRICFASSELVETVGKNESITVNATLVVEVLYPPSTPKIQLHIYSESAQDVTNNVTIEEFSSFSLSCSADSRPDANYIWLGQVNSSFETVTLQNVSRHECGQYTCHASNLMQRSFGRELKGQSNASEVIKFNAADNKENYPVITNQRENVTLICNVDSNPSSAIDIHFSEKLLVNYSNTKNLTHLITDISCYDAGIYYCYSSNKINSGTPSRKQLTLIVKCPPLPEKDIKFNVTTLKYVPATLSFKAMDYLDIHNTSFTWQKKINASQWETVKDDTNEVKISTFNLQTNLTIVNVTGSYSGNYRVVYNNSVGGSVQMFQLSVADLPDTPKSFDYLKDSLTSTQVTVVWTKGYNGGLRQTYVLNISQSEQTIKYDSVHETENEYMQHTITGLSSGTQYHLTLWAKNELGKSLPLSLTVVTKESEHETPSNLTAPIAGIISSLVVVVAVVAVAFMLYKRRIVSASKSEKGKLVYQNVLFEGKTQTRNKTKAKVLREKTKAHDIRVTPKTKEETSFQVLQEVDDMSQPYKERTEYYNSAEKIAEIEKIKVSELLPYVNGRGEELFETEYQKLPTGLEHPCTFARKPENIALNRYNGIYPYDHSRVKIEGRPDFFINACYIDGYTTEKEYIASLGPTKKVTYNFQTFWLMVWNERSDIIVMLTNLNEPSGMKCEQYWPEYDTTQCYGDIQVSSDEEEVFAEYTVRVFIVSNSGERRTVTHLHYTAWPDKKVPEDVTTLIEFRERLKATPSARKGPVIVHCSAGIGRTGTLIALDRLIKEGQNESSVDVFKCVNSMREQRVKMVQTLEQYIYIYKALVNSLYFNCEMIPLESFNEYVDTTNNNIYSKQFQQLKETVEDCIKDKSDTHAESEMIVDKNRRGADIPGKQLRVFVYLNRNMDDSDYINAVYVNSFRIKDHFISAQSPLPSTVTDFVCMMYQENCCCVVTMEDLNEPGMKVGHYLPTDGQQLTFGDILISCTVLEKKPQYTVREMRLQNHRQTENREKVAYHFHYTKWMQGNDTPIDATEFVQFVKDVEDYADQLGEEQSHVLVHCLKANERSALYSIVAILTEKIRYERQVSVLSTVRHLRTRRRTAITSMEQLKFCYQAVKAYINLFE